MDVTALIFKSLSTGSHALAPVFACLWWMERKDNRQTMKDIAARMSKIAEVLAELKGRIR